MQNMYNINIGDNVTFNENLAVAEYYDISLSKTGIINANKARNITVYDIKENRIYCKFTNDIGEHIVYVKPNMIMPKHNNILLGRD